MSYSWGDDTGGSRSVGGSDLGYDYKSARKAYDAGDIAATPASGSMRSSMESRTHDYRSRIGRTEAPVGKDILTTSTHPIGVTIDVTGSMSTWPGIFFEKLPLLGMEVEHYVPDYAISFSVFGDCYCDKYPLQVRDFEAGEKLDAHIAALYPEANGGDTPEDPQLVAYYYLNHCKMDKAVKPIFFIVTDAIAHDTLTAEAIKKYTGDVIQERTALNSKDILKKLGEKFSVYVLLKGMDAASYWRDVYGEQRVKQIKEPRDVVELMIACIASEMGEIKDFEMRSSKRHEDRPDRVERVMKSVKSDSPEATPEEAGKASKASKAGDSKKSKSMKSKKLV